MASQWQMTKDTDPRYELLQIALPAGTNCVGNVDELSGV